MAILRFSLGSSWELAQPALDLPLRSSQASHPRPADPMLTRMAYGDFAGFLIAWGYWISIWASLPVIAIAFAGAVFNLFPSLHNRPMAVILTLGAIWTVVFVNLRGVKAAGIFAEVTTYTRLVPFAAIALMGLFFIDTSHFSEFN